MKTTPYQIIEEFDTFSEIEKQDIVYTMFIKDILNEKIPKEVNIKYHDYDPKYFRLAQKAANQDAFENIRWVIEDLDNGYRISVHSKYIFPELINSEIIAKELHYTMNGVFRINTGNIQIDINTAETVSMDN